MSKPFLYPGAKLADDASFFMPQEGEDLACRVFVNGVPLVADPNSIVRVNSEWVWNSDTESFEPLYFTVLRTEDTEKRLTEREGNDD